MRNSFMSNYNVLMEFGDSTVVTEYEQVKKRSEAYQSEADLENEFIRILSEQGYEYLKIHDTETLISNLRTQLDFLMIVFQITMMALLRKQEKFKKITFKY